SWDFMFDLLGERVPNALKNDIKIVKLAGTALKIPEFVTQTQANITSIANLNAEINATQAEISRLTTLQQSLQQQLYDPNQVNVSNGTLPTPSIDPSGKILQFAASAGQGGVASSQNLLFVKGQRF